MSAIFKKLVSIFLALIAAITALFGITPKDKADLVVSLYSNPSTGYSWQVTMDKEGIIKYNGSEFEPDKADVGMVGVGGTEKFSFEAVADGEVKITFEYNRSWETEPAIRTVVYNCEVKDGKINVITIDDSDLIAHIA